MNFLGLISVAALVTVTLSASTQSAMAECVEGNSKIEYQGRCKVTSFCVHYDDGEIKWEVYEKYPYGCYVPFPAEANLAPPNNAAGCNKYEHYYQNKNGCTWDYKCEKKTPSDKGHWVFDRKWHCRQ